MTQTQVCRRKDRRRPSSGKQEMRESRRPRSLQEFISAQQMRRPSGAFLPDGSNCLPARSQRVKIHLDARVVMDERVR